MFIASIIDIIKKNHEKKFVVCVVCDNRWLFFDIFILLYLHVHTICVCFLVAGGRHTPQYIHCRPSASVRFDVSIRQISFYVRLTIFFLFTVLTGAANDLERTIFFLLIDDHIEIRTRAIEITATHLTAELSQPRKQIRWTLASTAHN